LADSISGTKKSQFPPDTAKIPLPDYLTIQGTDAGPSTWRGAQFIAFEHH
jgi:hypothetical protein